MDPKEARSVAQDDVPQVAQRVRLIRDGLVNNFNFVLSALVGVCLVPFMLRHLGAESYGLYIATVSLTGVLGAFDFGIGWTVVRDIAASRSKASDFAETCQFVHAASVLFLFCGVVGGAVIAIAGLLLGSGLKLSAGLREIATSVFALAALGFLADRLAGFQQIVLQGLRRFQVVAALSLSVTVLRAVGIVVVLQDGRGLVSVMVWQVIASIAGLITAIEIVSRIETSLGFRIAPFSWA